MLSKGRYSKYENMSPIDPKRKELIHSLNLISHSGIMIRRTRLQRLGKRKLRSAQKQCQILRGLLDHL